MSPITAHILDVSRGVPGAGISVTLERGLESDDWQRLSEGTSDSEGRVKTLLPEGSLLTSGRYRLIFETGRYFGSLNLKTLFPIVTVVFEVKETTSHLHIPLLLSPFGYTTYRGT